MNAIDDKERARDRLTEAALRQIFDQRPATLPAPARPRPDRRGLAAAVLIAGIGVVAATAWLGREPGDAGNRRAAQGPRPMPPVTTAAANDLGELDPTTVNLEVAFGEAVDLRPLARFTNLRRLLVLSDRDASRDAEAFGAGDFAPLAAMPTLEELWVITHRRVTNEHVAALADLPKLHTLRLGRCAEVTTKTARALGTLPRLRRLDLTNLPIRPSFLRALPEPLEHLGLRACAGLDVPAYSALTTLTSLRSLAITMQMAELATSVDGALRPLRDLDGAAFRAFRELPALTKLDLDESSFEDRWLDELPASLQSLDLGARELTADSILALRRLGNLRELAFDHGTEHAACARLLAALPVEKLTLHGGVEDAIVTALARHPTLAELWLTIRRPVSLAPLAGSTRLRHLTLRYTDPLVDEPAVVREGLQALRDGGVEVTVLDERSRTGK